MVVGAQLPLSIELELAEELRYPPTLPVKQQYVPGTLHAHRVHVVCLGELQMPGVETAGFGGKDR